MPETYPTPQPQTGKHDADFKPHDPSTEAEPRGTGAFSAHKAHPGPVIPQSMPEQEGTKEEREAKAKQLNDK
ncbi:hypothetical protein F4809DRAFT_618312 [Biscogniauxia mediterranea]|nr:hypothetical protein F4809DRAFT_618312 [Biscogniauxia mediterranea]